MLIESPDSLKQMIDQGIVKIVAPLLLDSAGSVRNAAAGSLRNLSTTSLEACDMLMENDIMTPLVFYFHEVQIQYYFKTFLLLFCSVICNKIMLFSTQKLGHQMWTLKLRMKKLIHLSNVQTYC